MYSIKIRLKFFFNGFYFFTMYSPPLIKRSLSLFLGTDSLTLSHGWLLISGGLCLCRECRRSEVDLEFQVSQQRGGHSLQRTFRQLSCQGKTGKFKFGSTGYSIDPGILVPEKKVNFFWAPIQKAHEYVLNLRRQLSSSLASVAAHRSKFGIFTVTKHPSIRAFVPKKVTSNFFVFQMS